MLRFAVTACQEKELVLPDPLAAFCACIYVARWRRVLSLIASPWASWLKQKGACASLPFPPLPAFLPLVGWLGAPPPSLVYHAKMAESSHNRELTELLSEQRLEVPGVTTAPQPTPVQDLQVQEHRAHSRDHEPCR